MAITLVGANSSDGTSSVSVSVPSDTQAGDVMYLFLSADEAQGGVAILTEPEGWTSLGEFKNGSTEIAKVYRKTAGSSDASSSVSATFTADRSGATVRVYRGDPLFGGQWLVGEPLTIPVALDAGDLFVAFVWSSGPVVEFVPDDDAFEQVDFHRPNNNYSYGTISGEAAASTTSVTITANSTQTGGAVHVAAFTLTGTPLPGPARIRSHVAEDAGSLFQATQAVAVESAVSEAFPFDTSIAGALRPYREALTPDDIAIQYYPIPTRNQEMLVTLDGETKLGRMARVYPDGIMARVPDISALAGDTATPQEVIQYIFNQWGTQFDWFTTETVPDLRLLVDGAAGAQRQFYIDNPEAGVLAIEAIAIPQEDNERRSMREIVDEWLGIFPGTVIRQNSAGNIELVTRVGPDAPDGASVELEWRDIINLSDGEDDPRGVINRARVVSQGWSFEDSQAVVADSYNYQPRPGQPGLSEAVVDGEGDIPTAEFVGYLEVIPFTSIVHPTDDVKVTVTVSVFGSWQENSSDQYGLIVTESEEFDLSLGETGTVTVSVDARGSTSVARFTVRREHIGISLHEITGLRSRHFNPFGSTWLGYVTTISATGTAWTKAAGQTVAEFGYSSEVLPGSDGENALETSVGLYGEREATIRSDVFQLTPEQAQAVARAYVLFNINPMTARDVQQSEWDKYPVKFDHIGQLVNLPNGETAVVENRAYTDSFQAGGGLMQSSFTATVTDTVIDTDTAFLLNDDGSFFENDDGSISEEL